MCYQRGNGDQNPYCDGVEDNNIDYCYLSEHTPSQGVIETEGPAPPDGTTQDATPDATPVWVVTWHVSDHAEGQVYTDMEAAQHKFNELDGGAWAARLYDKDLVVLQQYGGMGSEEWGQLDEWARIHTGGTAVATPASTR